MGNRGGRPKKSTADPIAPAAWHRIKTLVTQGVLDPVHASEIGRLSYFGELSAAQTATAFRIGEIYGRYERSVGKRRAARSPSYEIGFSQGNDAQPCMFVPKDGRCVCGSTEPCEDARRDVAARDAWERVQKEIPIEPPLAKGLIEDLCVEDRPVNSLHLDGIRRLLDRVARKLGTAGTEGNSDPFYSVRAKRANGVKAVAPARTPWGTIEHETWRAVIGRLRPDLCSEDLELSYVTFCTLKDRARFRRAKEATKNKP